MKRFYPTVLAVFLLSFLTVPLYAKDSGDPVKKAEIEKAQKKKTELRKAIELRRTDINGTQWETTLIPSDKKEKSEPDTLTFQNGRVSSKVFSTKGFSQTNYTVTLPEGTDKGVWETMQTSSDSKEGVVFIHGEWLKDTMTGQVTQQLDGGKTTKEYYFTTASRKAIAPSTAKANMAQPQAAASGKAEQNPLMALISKEKAQKPAPEVTAEAAPTKKTKYGL